MADMQRGFGRERVCVCLSKPETFKCVIVCVWVRMCLRLQSSEESGSLFSLEIRWIMNADNEYR